MRKDNVMDYAVAAFRLYASMGKPSYEDAKEAIYQKALQEAELLEPARAMVLAEQAVSEQTPMLLDIMAVDKTLDMLERGNKYHIVRALSDVYFVQPDRPIRKLDITNRVHRHSLTAYASERSVYRWLLEARQLFAAVRGLRIAKNKR